MQNHGLNAFDNEEVNHMPSIQDSNNSMSRSDEELQNLTVGELKLHNANITLVEYDPHWPKAFEQEANRIRSVLGKKALHIEHVGSTSVPGLCAKPIIDLMLVYNYGHKIRFSIY